MPVSRLHKDFDETDNPTGPEYQKVLAKTFKTSRGTGPWCKKVAAEGECAEAQNVPERTAAQRLCRGLG